MLALAPLARCRRMSCAERVFNRRAASGQRGLRRPADGTGNHPCKSRRDRRGWSRLCQDRFLSVTGGRELCRGDGGTCRPDQTDCRAFRRSVTRFRTAACVFEHGFHGVMVDTADKTKGRLLDHMPPEHIPDFVGRAKTLRLMTGLSGSLEAPDIPRLLPFAPDFLGFSGALCKGTVRTGAIDAEAVKQIRSLIPEEQAAGRSARVDYRLLAARGYSPGASTRRLARTRSTSATSFFQSRSAPTVSSMVTPRKCAST